MGIAIGVLAAIAALFGFAATRPNQFRTQRSLSINAPPEKILASLTDFRKWTAWSPWKGIDPNLKRTYSGTNSGKGAIYEWTGNKQVGQGRMEITEVNSPSQVVIKLDFLAPFEAHNTAEFVLEPDGQSTDVTWAMYGARPFPIKLMGLVVNMDKLVGKDFEKGLARLKSVVEA